MGMSGANPVSREIVGVVDQASVCRSAKAFALRRS